MAPAEPKTLLDAFAGFAGNGNECTVYDNGFRSWTYTYAQIAAAANNFAARLRDSGIGKNDKVLIWAESCPEWIAAFWGCVLRGAIVVPIDHQRSVAFVARIRGLVGGRAVLIGDGAGGTELGSNTWRLSELQWTDGAVVSPAPLAPDDIVEIVFTSGATGEPKGVLITHRNILANLVGARNLVNLYGKYAKPLRPLRFLSLMPLSHMFGQMLTLFVLPLIPASAVLMRGLHPEEVAKQLRRRRVTAMIAVPKMLDVLQNHILQRFPEASEPDDSHWTRRWFHYRRIHRYLGWRFWAFLVGGAPLSRESEDFWRKLGLPVVQGYGLTETAPIVAFNNPFAIGRGSAGRVMAGTEVRLEPDGEILVRGPIVSPGYWNAPKETEQAFRDGWFHTGDIGEWDPSGRLVIRGRKKEMIVLPDGQKVFPDDVERVLLQVPGVREAAVAGRDHVHAVLVVDAGADPGQIVKEANVRLEAHQRIHQVALWPGATLPRTEATHKIKRTAIQQWLDGTASAQAAAGAGGSDVLDLIRQHAPGRAISDQTTLDDLGLSSLERVDLLVDLEQRLGTPIEESSLTGESTVGALAALPSPAATFEFPTWNRHWTARFIRKVLLTPLLLPLTRIFAHVHVSGQNHLRDLRGPVIFAPNHQSHLDTPVILAALPGKHRHRVAVAMWKEYFDPHFFPQRYPWWRWLGNSVSYLLATTIFNAFPLPQTEARAAESLRYIGDLVSEGWSILYFPEGERTTAGEIKQFQPGIGFLAARLGVQVVPVRLTGLDRVLGRAMYFPRPGRVKVAFGAPLTFRGNDFPDLAAQVREAVLSLP